MMKYEIFILLAAVCFVSTFVSSENSTISPKITTISALKCTRDYHCPSKCDVCLSGICTHQLNLNCTRDYHCPACEVCRSGKCVEGDKNCESSNDCDIGGWCLDSKCIENKCQQDSDCGTEKVICKFGKCENT